MPPAPSPAARAATPRTGPGGSGALVAPFAQGPAEDGVWIAAPWGEMQFQEDLGSPPPLESIPTGREGLRRLPVECRLSVS
jgi:hypothetical protein